MVSDSKEEKEVIEEKKEEKVVTEKKSSNLGRIIYGILKVFVFLTVLLPLWLVILSFTLALVVVLYYSIIGINLWGLVLIFLGMLLITCNINHFINNLLNHKKNHYYGLTLIPFVVICVGVLVLFNSLRYYKESDYSRFNFINEKYEYNINGKTELKLNTGSKNYTIDNTMEDGKIIVEISYCKDIYEINRYSYENMITLNASRVADENFWDIYDKVIEGLKNYEMFKSNKFYQIDFNIYGNEKTLKNLNIRP